MVRSVRVGASVPSARSCLVALAVAGVAACARERVDPPRGVLVVSTEQQGSWVRNFNPLLAPGSARWPCTSGIYEPMLVWNTMSGEYVPWLAESSQWSPDGRSLTFTLRQGVAWSDGQPFSARDVAFTFGLMKRHRAIDHHAVWDFLDSVTAVGERRIEFALRRVFMPALGYLGQQPIVAEHVWKNVADPVRYSNENPVATGPFTEVRVFQNQVYELGKNPHYWQKGMPKLEALRFPAFPNNDAANMALANGEVDWAGNFVPAIERTYVKKDPRHHGWWFPLVGGPVVLYANTTREPFHDVRVRKALSMAIDRALIVKIAMYDYTRPADATGLSDAFATWRDPTAVAKGDWVKLDVARANALLDTAGLPRGPDGIRRLPDGRSMSYDIHCVSGWSDWVRAVQVVARGWRAVGVDATLRTYDFGAWFEQLEKGEFDVSIGWTEEGPTPYQFYRGLMSKKSTRPVGQRSALNWHRFGSESADRLLERFEAERGRDEQMRLAAELQHEFVDNAPVIPLFLAPSWGEYNTRRFTGFPTEQDPYAKLTPNNPPENLLVLVRLAPR